MIKFPYGISHFRTIRTEGYYYLDRSDSIPALEEAAKQLVFLRPRRFGKSLLVSTLAHYYDINKAAEFDTLFGDLAIGQSPTAEHNQYMVLHWDFSEVSGIGDTSQVTKSLFDYLNDSIRFFVSKYASSLSSTVHINTDNALSSVRSLFDAVRATDYQLYVLIDEYDNFANDMLIQKDEGRQRYKALLTGEGVFKTLFKSIKSNATNGAIGRVFITGVSPLVLSDMTSGYNIGTPITQEPQFNALCGIKREELIKLVKPILEHCEQPTLNDSVLSTMKDFYNGYRFTHDMKQPLIYNPTLCFYFLRHYQKHSEAPVNMLDGNLAMDAGRIKYVAQLPSGNWMIDQIMDENNRPTLRYLEDQFGVETLHDMQHNPDYILSWLYYFGVLTVVGENHLRQMILGVPNLVVQALYVEQIKQYVLPESLDKKHAQQLAEAFYQSADLTPVADYLEANYLSVLSNRDYQWSNELTIKMAFLTFLFDGTYYVMDSETAVKRRYTDLLMIVRDSMRSIEALKDFVLEFKFIKLGDLSLSGEEVRKQSREGLVQLPLVRIQLDNALEQLRDYREVLNSKYQQPDRLCCLAVVVLGFDRVVWEVL